LQQAYLCRLCGHSRSTCKQGKEQTTSRTWRKAIKHYKRNAQKMTEY